MDPKSTLLNHLYHHRTIVISYPVHYLNRRLAPQTRHNETWKADYLSMNSIELQLFASAVLAKVLAHVACIREK